MAKGKTNQPLRILVDAPWWDHPAVARLREAGHTVNACVFEADAILHPAAFGWHAAMFVEDTKKDGTKYYPYVEAMLAAGRARKRGNAK